MIENHTAAAGNHTTLNIMALKKKFTVLWNIVAAFWTFQACASHKQGCMKKQCVLVLALHSTNYNRNKRMKRATVWNEDLVQFAGASSMCWRWLPGTGTPDLSSVSMKRTDLQPFGWRAAAAILTLVDLKS